MHESLATDGIIRRKSDFIPLQGKSSRIYLLQDTECGNLKIKSQLTLI